MNVQPAGGAWHATVALIVMVWHPLLTLNTKLDGRFGFIALAEMVTEVSTPGVKGLIVTKALLVEPTTTELSGRQLGVLRGLEVTPSVGVPDPVTTKASVAPVILVTNESQPACSAVVSVRPRVLSERTMVATSIKTTMPSVVIGRILILFTSVLLFGLVFYYWVAHRDRVGPHANPRVFSGNLVEEIFSVDFHARARDGQFFLLFFRDHPFA